MTRETGAAPAAPLSASTTLTFAAAAGWPSVRLGVLELDSEDAWRRALESYPRPTVGELRSLVDDLGAPWACDALVATEAARARLGAWHLAGRPAASVDRVTVAGDDSLTAAVHSVLRRLPPPVLDHVRRNGIVLPVGRADAGFCLTLPPPAADATEARRLLVCGWFVDDARFAGTVAHEVAHHWLVRAPAVDLAPRSDADVAQAREDHETLLTLAAAWNLVDELTDPAELDEYQACRLAETWGFPQHAVRCARNASDHIRRAVAERAAARNRS